MTGVPSEGDSSTIFQLRSECRRREGIAQDIRKKPA